jgi:ABC-2 type transport system permease protein
VRGLALPPGSTPWLLAHELKLSLRGMTGRKGGSLSLIIVGAGVVIATLAGGVPMALWLRRVPIHETALLIMGFDIAMAAIFTLILSQTLASATMAFYERGDLDLLLSSPIPSRRVLTVRAVGIATVPFLWFAMILTIAALPLALVGQPRWLAGYPVLASIALLAAAAGLSIAMSLFKLIGARATRTVGQLLAAVIGAAFFLVSQSRNFLPDGGRAVFGGVVRWAGSGVFEPGTVLSWPARAVLGEPLPLVVFVGFSVVIFMSVAAGLGRRFSADASVAAGMDSGRARASHRVVSAKSFGGGVFVTLMRKELRLLIRDPTLLSQVLLRTLYVLPLTFVMLKNAGPSPSGHVSHVATMINSFRLASLAGGVTFMAGQVAGSLAWITISAEDAPELLAVAPVDGGLVRRAKLAATMIPVVALLALPLGALAWLSPWIGACAILGSVASAGSAGLINLWFEKPAPRKAFRNRRGGSVVGAIAEMLLGLGWAVTAGMAAALSPWALIPAAVTLVAMGVFYGVSEPDRAY